MPPNSKSKKAAPEEGSTIKTLFLWGFILLLVSGIAAMIITNPKQKTLNCNRAAATTLTSFGSCSEE